MTGNLLHGFDTIQCAYYLHPFGGGIDFQTLAEKREYLRNLKRKESAPITLGNSEFLLAPHGTRSGFPFLLTNSDFKIELGEHNTPNFFVTFKSEALWRESAHSLHEKFLAWARSLGYESWKPEALSRVDYCFDYHLPVIDFDEDSFKSYSSKDSIYRENGKAQTFTFGRGDVVLRVYDKVAEIEQKSGKAWFFLLWDGPDKDVWRIEWQVRKEILKRFDIRTFDDLAANLGDLLRYLAEDHDTLRIPTSDANTSRWPLHPLWLDLHERIRQLPHTGIFRVYGEKAALDERLRRINLTIYGYAKRIAAINSMQSDKNAFSLERTLERLNAMLRTIHEPHIWDYDVNKRVKEMELGQW